MALDRVGKVYLVGAGPGDPELISVKGKRLIGEADVVVYDALANPSLLAGAREDAELIDAGKRAKEHRLTQDQTNALLAEKALAGKVVVRLKGGDPYVFGRGGEEAIYLHERGVAVEVVPGMTAGAAAPAYAGIPVTHRQIATTVTFITGHEDPTKEASQVDYAGLAKLAMAGGTLCFYMGMGRLERIVAELTGHGLEASTPAAVVQWGTTAQQRSVRATVGGLVEAVERAGLGAPAIVVVGQVAGLGEEALNWFERRPLFGQTVVVTRTRQQASELRQRLEHLGARVLEAPTIAIEVPESWEPVDAALRELKKYDWLVLTSVNGVAGLRRRLAALAMDARDLAGVKVAAIGDATAGALAEMGIRADLVPTDFVAESLAAELIAEHDVAGKRFLLLRADIARPALIERLEEAGAEVDERTIYQTIQAAALPEEVTAALEAGEVDWVTFTSSSTARNFLALLGGRDDLAKKVKVASIGPITTQTVCELGLEVAVEAEVYNIEGLIKAMVKAVGESKSA